MMKRISVLLVTASACAILAGCTTVPESATPGSAAPAQIAPQPGAVQPPNQPWRHELSDVKPDPTVRYGTLPNGMKYALRRNVTPPGEAVFRLHVDAGSLNERDDQLGLAHFTEHMIFNGTKNVPEGEFVQRLERLGLSFGGGTNAHTSFDETVYKLNLPSTRDEVVDTALLLFRETAGEASMDPAAIERERGVVLAEERMGGGVQFRLAQHSMNFMMKGLLHAQRMPIGSPEIIRTAPRERFVEFYNAWYRPENTTLIAVGDFDVDELERKVRARFGDWRGTGRAGTPPVVGEVPKRGTEVSVFVEPGAQSAVLLNWIRPPESAADSIARRQLRMKEFLATAIVNERLSRIMQGDNPPFIEASLSHTDTEHYSVTEFTGSVPKGGWKRALEVLEREQRRAVQYGVTKEELDRVIKNTRASFASNVAAANTRTSSALAGALLSGVTLDAVTTTPQDRLAMLDGVAKGLTAEQVSDVLRGLFEGAGGPLVYVASPVPITGAERTVAQAFDQSRQVAVAAPAAVPVKPWSYTSFGTPGRVVERREIADLGTTFIRFANGVRLTVRPSRKRENSIGVRVRAGNGELDLNPNGPGINWAASQAFLDGGLGRLTAQEARDALVGRRYGAGLNIEENAFSLGGATQPQDFAIQMQVLAAYMTDPAFRPHGLEQARRSMSETLAMLPTMPMNLLALRLPEILRSGDLRTAAPRTPEALQATTMEDVKRGLAPMMSEAIEVLIVGDVTVEEAIARTAETFGALPPRREPSYPPGADRLRFAAATAVPMRLTHRGRADQGFGYIAWPTSDLLSNPRLARATTALAAVMRLRLNAELREKQAVTYSPSAANAPAQAYPGYGVLQSFIEAPAERLDAFFADIRKIARELRDAPPTQDELNRALQPIIEELETAREGNGYWLTALAGAQRDPRRLEVIRTALGDLRSLTPADIQQAAKTYLHDDRAFRAVVVPEVAPAKTASVGK